MQTRFPVVQYLLVLFAGWVNRRQLDIIAYVQEEYSILRKGIGKKSLRFTDDQRRRPAAKASRPGCKVLREIDSVVTSDPLLCWHRELIAKKWDFSQ